MTDVLEHGRRGELTRTGDLSDLAEAIERSLARLELTSTERQ
ncbi:MAG: hypothetical protein ABI321_00155 [Polyangia bacterium]